MVRGKFRSIFDSIDSGDFDLAGLIQEALGKE